MESEPCIVKTDNARPLERKRQRVTANDDTLTSDLHVQKKSRDDCSCLDECKASSPPAPVLSSRSENKVIEPRGVALNAFLMKQNVLTNGTFTNVTFNIISDYLSKKTVKALEELKYDFLTEIQYHSISSLMCGKSAILASRTGSGKTLAYVLPVIELLDELRFRHQFGTGAIIIAPTRELCLQIHDLLKKVLIHHQKSCFLVIGGARRKQEVFKLTKGVTFVIGTPGRLLDHFKVILTTATLSERVHTFAQEIIGNDFESFEVSPEEKITVNTLLQGKMDQKERTKIFFSFCKADSSILLCTDVAARGLDIPYVDCILQYDPPYGPKEYVHRVGRTARAGSFGEALLFLRFEEIKLLDYLKKANVPISECVGKIEYEDDMQKKFEATIDENKFLRKLALKAYVSFIRSYSSHNLKDVYNITEMNFTHVAKSFGFSSRPKVHLGVKILTRQRSEAKSIKLPKLKISKLKPKVQFFSDSDS